VSYGQHHGLGNVRSIQHPVIESLDSARCALGWYGESPIRAKKAVGPVSDDGDAGVTRGLGDV
jgi:hypothetical protein